MAKLLLNLRDVPKDELDDVTALLDSHGIPHHQTPPGPLALTAARLWVSEDDDLPRARSLLDAYQRERADRARAEWAQARAEGRAPTLWGNVRANPQGAAILVLAVLVALVLAALPFFALRG